MDLTQAGLSSIVTISLKATGAELKVHKDVLCAHSEYATACLRPNFVEGQEGKIILKDEEDEESLRTLISWMYSGKAVIPRIPADDNAHSQTAYQKHWMWLVGIYTMVDKYLMAGFKNDLINRAWDLCQKWLVSDFPDVISSLMQLPATDGLRRLTTDYLICTLKHTSRSQVRADSRRLTFSLAGDGTKNLRDRAVEFPEFGSALLLGLLQPDLPIFTKSHYVRNEDDEDSDDSSVEELDISYLDVGRAPNKRRRTQ